MTTSIALDEAHPSIEFPVFNHPAQSESENASMPPSSFPNGNRCAILRRSPLKHVPMHITTSMSPPWTGRFLGSELQIKASPPLDVATQKNALNHVAPSLVIHSRPSGSSLLSSCRCVSTLSARAGLRNDGASGCTTVGVGLPNTGCGQLFEHIRCFVLALSHLPRLANRWSQSLLPAVASFRSRPLVCQRDGGRSRPIALLAAT